MSNVDLLGRRKFIAGLGIAAGAAMVAPAMAVSEKADGVKWDKEVEIVIIGSGFAVFTNHLFMVVADFNRLY